MRWPTSGGEVDSSEQRRIFIQNEQRPWNGALNVKRLSVGGDRFNVCIVSAYSKITTISLWRGFTVAIEYMVQVYKTDLPTSEKFILLVIADHSDHHGRCWPSQERIARMTSLSVRTVERCISSLIDKKYLTIIKKHRGTGQTNHYKMMVEVPDVVSGGKDQSTRHGVESTRHGVGKYPTQCRVNRNEPSRTGDSLSAEQKQHQKDLAQKALDEHMARLASRRNN